MNCLDARDWFSGWVDETLTAEERARVDAHLAQCPDCRRELDRFRETVALLHRVEPPRAPGGFVPRVLEAARPAPWHRRLFQRLFLPLSVKLPAEAAAVLLVAGLAVYVFQRTPELQQAARKEAFQAPARSEAPPAPASAPTPAPALREAAPSAPGDRPSKPQLQAKRKVPAASEDARRSASEEAAKAAPSRAPAAPALPPPSAAPKAELKKETEAQGLAAPRAPEPAPPQSRPAPATEGRADSDRDKALRSSAPPAASPRSAMRLLAPADVVGRLTVKDRDAAERALGELLTRSGGAVISRRDDAGITVVEVAVPKTAYPEFSQGLAAIGAWLPEAQPSDLPPNVRVTLRVVE